MIYDLAYLDEELVGSSYAALTHARLQELHRRGVPEVVIWANSATSAPVARRLGIQQITTADFLELDVPGG